VEGEAGVGGAAARAAAARAAAAKGAVIRAVMASTEVGEVMVEVAEMGLAREAMMAQVKGKVGEGATARVAGDTWVVAVRSQRSERVAEALAATQEGKAASAGAACLEAAVRVALVEASAAVASSRTAGWAAAAEVARAVA
jgi:hypothetical protein